MRVPVPFFAFELTMRALARSRWLAQYVAACAVLLVCVGCRLPSGQSAGQVERGLVWVFPGVEGGRATVCWALGAFREAGVEAEIRVFEWQRPFGTLENLTDYEGNRAKAAEVAKRISAYRGEHPDAAVDLVGYSGGGGLAVMVAEALPEKVRLRNVILAQPALSPDYDLTAALLHIDGTLVNFHSPYDWLVLGWGTKLFGTMDRREVASAGKEGFALEVAVADAGLRAKVEQRRWRVEMIGTGHFGNHLGILGYWWNKRYVAPYLMRG